jgi:hypothetical protein
MLNLCPIIWFGVRAGFILTLDRWGMLKTGEGLGNIPRHQDVDFFALVVLLLSKSTVLLSLSIA